MVPENLTHFINLLELRSTEISPHRKTLLKEFSEYIEEKLDKNKIAKLISFVPIIQDETI